MMTKRKRCLQCTHGLDWHYISGENPKHCTFPGCLCIWNGEAGPDTRFWTEIIPQNPEAKQ